MEHAWHYRHEHNIGLAGERTGQSLIWLYDISRCTDRDADDDVNVNVVGSHTWMIAHKGILRSNEAVYFKYRASQVSKSLDTRGRHYMRFI